ncbi:hypothetical protein JCM5296_001874 [Sporobolomyces johnsonii]
MASPLSPTVPGGGGVTSAPHPHPHHHASTPRLKPTSPTTALPAGLTPEHSTGSTTQQMLPTPTSLPHLHHRGLGSLGSAHHGLFARPLVHEPQELFSAANANGGSLSGSDADEPVRAGRGSSGGEDSSGANGLFFGALDDDVEMDLGLDSDRPDEWESVRRPTRASAFSSLTDSATPGQSDASPFSSAVVPHRPFRARYASSISSDSPPPSTSAYFDFEETMARDALTTTSTATSHASHKRTFSHVSPSTGTTPPAADSTEFSGPSSTPHESAFRLHVDLPTGSDLSLDLAFENSLCRTTPADEPTAAAASAGRARPHSVESQRASAVRTAGDLAQDSSLRRRSPMLGAPLASETIEQQPPREWPRSTNANPPRLDRERGSSKRRRSSTLKSGAGGAEDGDAPAGATRTGTSTFAPALGRYPHQSYPIDPVLSHATTHTTSRADGADGFDLGFRPRSRLGLGLGRGSRLSLGCLPVGAGSRGTGGGLASELRRQRTRSTDEQLLEERTTSPGRRTFPTLPPWRRSSTLESRGQPSSSASSAFAVGSSTAFLPTPPLTTASTALTSPTNSSTSSFVGSSLLCPRSPRAQPSTSRERASDPLVSFWREERELERASAEVQRRGGEILREAEDTLRRRAETLRDAEESVQRARRLLESSREDRERERERVERLQRLPNVGALPGPGESGAERPVVGVRVGEGWPSSRDAAQPQSPPSPRRRRRSSVFSLSSLSNSPPSSPEQLQQSPDSAGTSSRARQFLTQLRARRPRLSRNSTSIRPPEVDTAPSASLPAQDLRRWTVPSPPLVTALAGSSFDEDAERAVADRFNENLLERRRVSASLDPGNSDIAPSTSLWGETEAGSSRSRFRGPTERANERWRRGEAPTLSSGTTMPASTSTSTATATTTAIGAAVPPWRRYRSTGLVTPAASSTSNTPPRMQDDHSSGAAAAYFSRRDESPSPRSRRRTVVRSTSLSEVDLDDILADLGGEEGRVDLLRRREGQRASFPNAPFNLTRRSTTTAARASNPDADPVLSTSRPSIRIPRPDVTATTTATSRSRASSRPRLRFDEDDASAAVDGTPAGWHPPQLPLMLPSGSAGRRMVFPHPASAAGRSDGLEAAEEGRSGATTAAPEMQRTRSHSPFGLFGPDHFTAESPDDDLTRRPTLDFQASQYTRPTPTPSSRRLMPWDEGHSANPSSRFNPFGDLPAPTTTTSSADLAASTGTSSLVHSRIPPARTSLADALSQFGSRTDSSGSLSPSYSSGDTTLRRRHMGTLASALDPIAGPDPRTDSPGDRLAQHRQTRMERLASLRRERSVMRALLGGSSPPGAAGGVASSGEPAGNARATPEPASPPRSPGARRRGLGEFFRGLGTGGRLITIFDDEDFGAFWGRDSAALDPRNYLDDDDFDTSYEALLRLSERLGDVKPKGVSADKLSTLRTFPYSEWPFPERKPAGENDLPAPVASTSALRMDEDEEQPEFARKGVEKEARCPVCLMDYDDDDECMLGHCGHGFHSDCLKAWLKDHGSCPVCRRDHTS